MTRPRPISLCRRVVTGRIEGDGAPLDAPAPRRHKTATPSTSRQWLPQLERARAGDVAGHPTGPRAASRHGGALAGAPGPGAGPGPAGGRDRRGAGLPGLAVLGQALDPRQHARRGPQLGRQDGGGHGPAAGAGRLRHLDARRRGVRQGAERVRRARRAPRAAVTARPPPPPPLLRRPPAAHAPPRTQWRITAPRRRRAAGAPPTARFRAPSRTRAWPPSPHPPPPTPPPSAILLEFWKVGAAPDTNISGGLGRTGSDAVLVENDPPLDVFFVAARGAPPVVETTDDGMTLFWWGFAGWDAWRERFEGSGGRGRAAAAGARQRAAASSGGRQLAAAARPEVDPAPPPGPARATRCAPPQNPPLSPFHSLPPP
jgi:hypothetical protein